MNRRGVGMFVVLGGCMVALSGCATQDKPGVSQADAANRRLSDDLNRTRGERDAARRAKEEADRLLQAARAEAESLRRRMAEAPPAQETAAPGWTPVPGGAVIAIQESVLFAPGRVVIREEAKRTLDSIASTLDGQYAEKDILILGHTDDRPIKKSGWDDNWQLSTERALSVARYLKDHSVHPNRIVAGGCGEFRPRIENSNDANRTKNRRVEVYAVDPQLRMGSREP